MLRKRPKKCRPQIKLELDVTSDICPKVDDLCPTVEITESIDDILNKILVEFCTYENLIEMLNNMCVENKFVLK
ncbi:hypothetical protein JTE90_029246 [Oedothorax gibbosus]|uniref:Uncharacterized protein n=1 Tax=Oedothorax gibbosus TaxID=931172 RepID=A0AAV6TVR6_9ARAC|nr:hypothetical protein JTE90_029246 [Oedothorax gibbosus]